MASERKEQRDGQLTSTGATIDGAPLRVLPECANAEQCVYVRASEHAFSLEARKRLMRVVFASRTIKEALSMDMLPAQAVVAAAYRVLQKMGVPCHIRCVYRTTPHIKAHTPDEQDAVNRLLQQGDTDTCVAYLVLLTPPVQEFDTVHAASAAGADEGGWLRVPKIPLVVVDGLDEDDAAFGWNVSDCVHLEARSRCVTMGAIAAVLGDDFPTYLMYTPTYSAQPQCKLIEPPFSLGTDSERVDAIVRLDELAPADTVRICRALQRMAEEDPDERQADFVRDNGEQIQRVQQTQVAEDAAAARHASQAVNMQ